MLKDELKNNEAVRLKDEDLEQVTGGQSAEAVKATGGAIYNLDSPTTDACIFERGGRM